MRCATHSPMTFCEPYQKCSMRIYGKFSALSHVPIIVFATGGRAGGTTSDRSRKSLLFKITSQPPSQASSAQHIPELMNSQAGIVTP